MSLFPVAFVQRDGCEMLPCCPVNCRPVIPDVVECLFLLFLRVSSSVHGHFGSFQIWAPINKLMRIFLYVHLDTDGFILRSKNSDVV